MIIPQSYPLYAAAIAPAPRKGEVGPAPCQRMQLVEDVWHGLVIGWDVTDPRETLPTAIMFDLTHSGQGGAEFNPALVSGSLEKVIEFVDYMKANISEYWQKHDKCDESETCLA